MPETKPPASGGEMYRAGLPSLGARLLAAGACVRAESVAADIGCDHGKLAVWLALQGKARRVIATDIAPLPLRRARALVQQAGCGELVDCRLGAGLAPLEEGEAQDIIIAGMSGETMAEILAGAPWVHSAGVRLVLVPVMRAEVLRRWLWQGGFAPFREELVEEKGKVYAVLCADYTGRCAMPTPLQCELGAAAGLHTPAARQYIRQRLRHLRNRLKAPMDETPRAQLNALAEEVEACLHRQS